MKKLTAFALALAGLFLAGTAGAEQMQTIGDFEAHYSLVPTTFLKPDIARHYQVTRARDRALLNVSVLDDDGVPVPARVSGALTNLLSQNQALAFREVAEGDAIYYLAEVEHTDREVLRFVVEITTPDGGHHQLEFQQKMYWEGR